MESSKKEEQPLKLGRVKVHGRQARVTDSLAERRLSLTYAGNPCVFSERARSKTQGHCIYLSYQSHFGSLVFASKSFGAVALGLRDVLRRLGRIWIPQWTVFDVGNCGNGDVPASQDGWMDSRCRVLCSTSTTFVEYISAKGVF